MTPGISDLPFRHWKIGHSRRNDRRRRLDQHGDVEMILEQVAGFDGGLVAAADENDTAAFELDDRYGRRGFRCNSKQRGHFGPARSASLDHPADSRILANWIGFARPPSAATSENRAASCVHPIVSGASSAAIVRKRSISARHS
jgi:hypothetical protein